MLLQLKLHLLLYRSRYRNQCPRCSCWHCPKLVAWGSSLSVCLLAEGEAIASLWGCGTTYIRLPRACLSQFLLKVPMPPKNLLYVSPFSLASYLTEASSMAQR